MFRSKSQKLFSAVLAMLLFLQLALPSGTLAAQSDASGHWAEDSLSRMVSLGILTGYTDGSLKPDNYITRAEFFTIINRAFGIETTTEISFTDVNKDDWFYSEISRAVAAGFTKGTSPTTVNPQSNITRQDAMVALGNIYELQKGSNVNFTDADQISTYAVGHISTLQSLGVVRGKGDGVLEPKAFITRGEAAKVLDLMLGGVISEDIADANLSGNILVTKKGTAIKDTNIDGNLYITGGVENGGINLDGVTVSGNIIVQGGGPGSVLLNNTSASNQIFVRKLVTKENANIEVSKDTNTDTVAGLNMAVHSNSVIDNKSSTALGHLTVQGDTVAGNVYGTVTAHVYGMINVAEALDFSIINIKENAVINSLDAAALSTVFAHNGSRIDVLKAKKGASISIEEGVTIAKAEAIGGSVTITVIASNGTKNKKIIPQGSIVAINADGLITEPVIVVPSTSGGSSKGSSGGSEGSGGNVTDKDNFITQTDKKIGNWTLSSLSNTSVTASVYGSVYAKSVKVDITKAGTSEDDIRLIYTKPYNLESGEYELVLPIISNVNRKARIALEKADKTMAVISDEEINIGNGINSVTVPVSVSDTVYAELSVRLGYFNLDEISSHNVTVGEPTITRTGDYMTEGTPIEEPDRFNNKLTNGDFSDGTNGWWATETKIEEVTVKVVDLSVENSSGVLSVPGGTKNPWDAMAGNYITFELKKDRTYTVSTDVYSDIAQDILLQIVDSADNELALRTLDVPADGNMHTFSFDDIVVTEDCIAKIAFHLGGYGNKGETYNITIDNLELYEVPKYIDVELNGDFSSGTEGWWTTEKEIQTETEKVKVKVVDLSVENGTGVFSIPGGIENQWGAMAGYWKTFELNKGRTYTVSMDVYSEVTQEIFFQIVDSTDNQLVFQTLSVPADGNMHTFSFDDIEVTEDINAKFAFAMGGFGTLGQTYKILIDNIRFSYPDLAIPVEEEDPFANMVRNSDYTAGTKNWGLFTMEKGIATFNVSNEEGMVNVKNNGTEDYSVQFYQDGMKLYKGNKYKLSFRYKSNVERSAEVRIQKNGGNYEGYLADNTLSFIDKWQTYEKEFEMTHESDTAARLTFNLGQEGEAESVDQKFYFDDFSLVMTKGTLPEEEKVNPIRLNQVGYRPNDEKVAFVVSKERTFKLYNSDDKLLMTGNLSLYTVNDKGNAIVDSKSGDIVRTADFTSLKDDGKYYVKVRTDVSPTFNVNASVYKDLTAAALKVFYYQRCGGEGLDEKYVGETFAHDPCHMSIANYYDPADETYGTVSAAVYGGWHDAGDYGRYVTPASKAIADLLLTAEYFPATKRLDFGGPDRLLEETRYELDWMLKMQNPETGGVYHKVTTKQHASMTVLPEEDNPQLYLSPVSAQAAGDFAAVMAYASRMYKNTDRSFSKECLVAAEKAWGWLEANPDVNAYVDPSFFGTGDYNDNSAEDERFWAATELYRTTGEDKYLAYIEENDLPGQGLGWVDMGSYALVSYLNNKNVDKNSEKYKEIKNRFIGDADNIIDVWKKDGYKVALDQYVWGSNKDLADRAMILIIANKLAPDNDYDVAILDQLHYFLGRNANDTSYVTGFGEKAAKNPHHRQSVILEQAVPGMLVGGPNGSIMTVNGDPVATIVNEETPDAKCYADVDGSFATNEMTIYWNSPLVFILGYLYGK
jgi:endoglucanase